MTVEEDAKIFAALADPVRLRLVQELRQRGKACGTDLSEALGISLSLVCHHTKALADAGLISKTKVGTSAVYVWNAETLDKSLAAWSSEKP